jgi:pimeloyl-ACP methyl ester carboxylesterase
VFLQHFQGTMDFWDPIVVEGFARERPVILFDNKGGSSGETPATVREMALEAAASIDVLGLQQVDLLGFSLGGFVAQVAAAEHAHRVRHLIFVGTGPEAATVSRISVRPRWLPSVRSKNRYNRGSVGVACCPWAKAEKDIGAHRQQVQGLLGQSALAIVAILGTLATPNLQLADAIIPETVRIRPLRSQLV